MLRTQCLQLVHFRVLLQFSFCLVLINGVHDSGWSTFWTNLLHVQRPCNLNQRNKWAQSKLHSWAELLMQSHARSSPEATCLPLQTVEGSMGDWWLSRRVGLVTWSGNIPHPFIHSSLVFNCCLLLIFWNASLTQNTLKRFLVSLPSLGPLYGWLTFSWKPNYYTNFLVFFSFLKEVKESIEGKKLEEVSAFSHTAQVSILSSVINHLADAISTELACVCFVRDQIWYSSSFLTIDTLYSDGWQILPKIAYIGEIARINT